MQGTVKKELSIVLCGAAGQGIQTIEQVLTHTLKRAGFHVFATREFMSRVRGGCNSTELRVATRPVRAFVERIDILLALSPDAVDHLGKRVCGDTVVIGAARTVGEIATLREVDFEGIAVESGGKLYANSVASGLVYGLLSTDFTILEAVLAKRFAAKGEKVVTSNQAAARAGHDLGKEMSTAGVLRIDMDPTMEVADDLFLDGATAVGLGGLAGGCNFVASYPMSPSTGVLTFFAQQAREFGIVVEQAEDEIAAVNLCLGAVYAGARALVTTSGGGFALMSEGMSLAGMTESPLVVHLAQRPGPATGLPTRTEQGDLNLALYAGHGEFPRILLAPGSIEEAADLTRRAFELADRFQVPVVLLTDQFLMDSYSNMGELGIENVSPPEHHFVKTAPGYKRYDLAGGPLSPRGIPGYGEGLVCLDSDEHDEFGHITEDLEMRVRMMDKRLGKLRDLEEAPWCFERIGPDAPDLLVLCWGSTRSAVEEALGAPGLERVAALHLKRVFPLPETAIEACKQAPRLAVLENNAGAALAALLQRETGIQAHHKILKYNGLPFSVEEITDKLKGLVE